MGPERPSQNCRRFGLFSCSLLPSRWSVDKLLYGLELFLVEFAPFFSIKLIVMSFFFTPIVLTITQYHGGTNFGRTSGGPYITTSYDYDADRKSVV